MENKDYSTSFSERVDALELKEINDVSIIEYDVEEDDNNNKVIFGVIKADVTITGLTYVNKNWSVIKDIEDIILLKFRYDYIDNSFKNFVFSILPY